MHEIKVCLDSAQYSQKPKGDEIGKISYRIAHNVQTLGKNNLKQFAEAVGEHGQTFCPSTFIDGVRRKSCFEQCQLVALDFDKGISFAEVKERTEKYELPILFAYETFSSVDHDRFRVVFLNDISIQNERAAEIIPNALTTVFNEADRSCNDVSKMFFGGKKLLYFDDKIPEINLESVARNMTVYLQDKYGATHYKNKLTEFSKTTGVKLNRQNLLEISVLESSNTEKSCKISPSSIILENRKGVGENLPTKYYCITFGDCTLNASAENKNPVNHADYRAYALSDAIESCQLLKEFAAGDRQLDHAELFGIATNLIHIETGTTKFCEFLSKSPNITTGKREKWDKDLRYMKQKRDYKPQYCNSFCLYKSQCEHGKDIMSTMSTNPFVKLDNLKDDYAPIAEVEENCKHKLVEAIKADDTKVHIIKAQPALGKSKMFIELMAESPLKWLVAAPTNDLKHELFERAKEQGIEVMETPSLREIDLPEDVESRINSLYESGRYRLVNPYLRQLIKDNAECSRQLQAYLDELEKFHNSDCNVITTHKKFMYMSIDMLKKYDVIIVDEDIILKTVVPGQVSIPIVKLKKLLEKTAPESAVSKKIRQVLDLIKTETYFKLDSIDFEDNADGISKTIDMPSFCLAEHFYFNKWKSENTIAENSLSKDSIIFLKPAKFKENIKVIIVSATVDETVYRYYFGADRVTFCECKTAKYLGELNQFPEKSMSRSCIDNDVSAFRKIKDFTNIHNRITFKKYSLGDLHFGNTEGRNNLKGQNIDVIGTPHQPEWIYKLFAYTIGLDFNLDAKIKPCNNIVHNGVRFRFTTYEDEVLRNIQFWMIESELEQSVGRARLLREDCAVNLFSNFPLRQATIKKFKP